MAETNFKHPIYDIAHPIVRRLIENEIEIRKFKACFPTSYAFLVKQKRFIKADLVHELELFLIRKNKYEKDEIKGIIDDLINDRRLLDYMIGYIQTEKITSQDEYLIRYVMSLSEILCIYNKVKEKFIIRIKGSESAEIILDDVLNQLESQDWYLPNLIPDWDVTDLLRDYVVLFFNYHQFDNDSKAIDNQNSGPLFRPSYAQLENNISPLFRYNRPLLNTKKAFIEHYNSDLNEAFLKLNIHLDEDPNKIANIFTDYILMYQSMRLDYLRRGTTEKVYIDFELKRLGQVSHKIISVLDGINNRDKNLARADSLVSALISLVYFAEVFELRTSNIKNKIDLCNSIISSHWKYKKENNIYDVEFRQEVLKHRRGFFDDQAKYDFKKLIERISEILKSDERLDVELIKMGKGSSLFTHLEIQLKETKLFYRIPIHTLSDKMDSFISNFYSSSECSESKDFLGVGDIFTAIFGRSIG